MNIFDHKYLYIHDHIFVGYILGCGIAVFEYPAHSSWELSLGLNEGLLAHLQADHSPQFSETTEQEYAFLSLPLRIHYLDLLSLACFGSEVL